MCVRDRDACAESPRLLAGRGAVSSVWGQRLAVRNRTNGLRRRGTKRDPKRGRQPSVDGDSPRRFRSRAARAGGRRPRPPLPAGLDLRADVLVDVHVSRQLLVGIEIRREHDLSELRQIPQIPRERQGRAAGILPGIPRQPDRAGRRDVLDAADPAFIAARSEGASPEQSEP